MDVQAVSGAGSAPLQAQVKVAVSANDQVEVLMGIILEGIEETARALEQTGQRLNVAA